MGVKRYSAIAIFAEKIWENMKSTREIYHELCVVYVTISLQYYLHGFWMTLSTYHRHDDLHGNSFVGNWERYDSMHGVMVSLDILFSVFSFNSNWSIASMKSRTYHKRSQTKPHFANYKLKLKPITLQCGVFPLRTMLNVAVDRGNSYRICVLGKIPQSQINCHHVWNWADNWHFLFVVVDKSIKQNVK